MFEASLSQCGTCQDSNTWLCLQGCVSWWLLLLYLTSCDAKEVWHRPQGGSCGDCDCPKTAPSNCCHFHVWQNLLVGTGTWSRLGKCSHGCSSFPLKGWFEPRFSSVLLGLFLSYFARARDTAKRAQQGKCSFEKGILLTLSLTIMFRVWRILQKKNLDEQCWRWGKWLITSHGLHGCG